MWGGFYSPHRSMQAPIHNDDCIYTPDVVVFKSDTIILGAFGCGAFENNPEVVAKASKAVVEKYKRKFKIIEFAVYCSLKDERNFRIFDRVING